MHGFYCHVDTGHGTINGNNSLSQPHGIVEIPGDSAAAPGFGNPDLVDVPGSHQELAGPEDFFARGGWQ